MKTIVPLFILLLAGCATLARPPEGIPPEARGAPIPAFAAFAFEKPAAPLEPAAEDTRSVLDDDGAVRGLLTDPLRKEAPALFARGEFLESSGPPAADVAREKRADLLVRLRLSKNDIVYLGRNGWVVPSLFIWFFTWFGAWFVPDETWASEVSLDIAVSDARTGNALFEKTLTARRELRLNDTHRGVSLLDPFLGPSGSEETYLQVAGHLEPLTLGTLRVEALKALAVDLRGALAEKKWAPAEETVFVCLGRNGPNTRFAEKDAAAVASWLREGAGGREGTRLLAGKDASGAGLRAELKAIEDLPFPDRVRVALYVAGAGFLTEAGEPALGSSGEPVALSEIVRVLGRVRDAVLIVDAGFGGAKDSRSAASGDARPKPSATWDAVLKAAPFPVLIAAAPGQAALESEEVGQGLFTSALLEGLRGAADADGNKTLTLGEVQRFILTQVKGQAAVMGKKQDPVFFGGRLDEALFQAP